MTDLNVSTVKTFKKNDYKKIFLKSSNWKKAGAIVVLCDYKLEGKKCLVAIPYKKPQDALAEYVKLKEDKLHPTRRVSMGTFTMDPSNSVATIEIKKGGMDAGLLQEKAEAAFSAIDIAIRVTGTSDDAAEALKEPDPEALTQEVKPTAPPKESELKGQLNAFADRLKVIAADFGTMMKGEIANRLKTKQSTEADLNFATALLDKIQRFIDDYVKSHDVVQEKLSKQFADIQMATLPKTQKICDMLEFSVAPEGGTGDKELDALLKAVRQKCIKFKADLIEMETKIKQGPTATPPSGQELLDILG